MDYKTEILMLLAYNAYFNNFGQEQSYSESKARAWAWDQVNTLTDVEKVEWFTMCTENMATLCYDYSLDAICLF